MATRVKEGLPAREKRGTSPSYTKSPRTSKQGSPAKRHSSPAATRSIPNYLKPTISSGLDTAKHHVKKHVSNDTAHKGTLSRRRSLEKPLAPFHIQKTQISPGPGERNARFSSFTSRTTTSKKLPSDRLYKASKDAGKDCSLHPRTVDLKTSSISMKRQETKDSTLSAKPQLESPPGKVDIAEVADIPKPEPPKDDVHSHVIRADEDFVNDGKNYAIADDNLVPEHEIHVNMTKSEPGCLEVQEVKMIESSVAPKDQDLTVGVMIEEQEDKLQVEEIDNNQPEVEQHGDQIEKYSSHLEENVIEGPIAKIEIKQGEEAREDTSVETYDQKEESNAASQKLSSHETESAEKVAKEVKQETEKPSTHPQVIQRKRESALVSNDVIEETASRLREQRKNKVKALAGAFETVISLQESK